MDNEITKLFKKHNSDKASHEYSEVYISYFEKLKGESLTILEIGVADGNSIRTWSEYFQNSKIIGIDIKKTDIKEKNLEKNNIYIHQGSQSDKNFINDIISKYKEFDIIIDDGSHFPKDVVKSFHLLFPYLKLNGLYFVEDTQTSYNHFFHGNPFDLKYANTHMNFFKNLTDSLNYQEVANPFYIKKKYDSKVVNVSFYHNLLVVKKGENNKQSNLVLDHSYENKRYNTKVNRSGKKIKYFIKYKVLFKIYTLFLYIFNFFKKLILLRF